MASPGTPLMIGWAIVTPPALETMTYSAPDLSLKWAPGESVASDG